MKKKPYAFSAKEGFSNFCLEERRKGFVGVILVGHQCYAWLVAMVEEAILLPVKEDIVKSYLKDANVLMVHEGGNKAGRFLELAVYAEGGHPKGL